MAFNRFPRSAFGQFIQSKLNARGIGQATRLWIYAPLGAAHDIEAINTDDGSVAWTYTSTSANAGHDGLIMKVRASAEGVWIVKRPTSNTALMSLQLVDYDGVFVRGQTFGVAGVTGLIDSDMAIDGNTGYIALNNVSSFYRSRINLTTWAQDLVTTSPVPHTLRQSTLANPGNRSIVSATGDTLYTTHQQVHKPFTMLKNSLALDSLLSPADNTNTVIAAKVTTAQAFVTQDYDGRIYYRPNGAQTNWSILTLTNPVVTPGPSSAIVYITKSSPHTLVERAVDFTVNRSLSLGGFLTEYSRAVGLSRLTTGSYVVAYTSTNPLSPGRLASISSDFSTVQWTTALSGGSFDAILTRRGYCINARGEGFSPGTIETW